MLPRTPSHVPPGASSGQVAKAADPRHGAAPQRRAISVRQYLDNIAAVMNDGRGTRTWATRTTALAPRPESVVVRRQYVHHGQPKPVEDLRRSLPKKDRPPAARLITGRDSVLQVHLTALFVATTQTRPGATWRNVIPLTKATSSSAALSWMDLLVLHARRAEGCVHSGSRTQNKYRQITWPLGRLRDDGLVALPRVGGNWPYEGFTLLREDGISTAAEAVDWRHPTAAEPKIKIPAEFFTRGWVHLLEDSEIAAYLMWLDRHQNGRSSTPFVAHAIRVGHYGLSRDTYESHQRLEAFRLLDVTEDEHRRDDGRMAGYGREWTAARCHRVALVPDGLTRKPAEMTVRQALAGFLERGRWGASPSTKRLLTDLSSSFG